MMCDSTRIKSTGTPAFLPFMKNISRPFLFASLFLLFLAIPIRSEDFFVSQFNDAASLSGWRFDYGGVTHTIDFDLTQDASNNAASGSLKVAFGFDAATLIPSGHNNGAVTIDFSSALDGSTFVTMEMDLKIDTGSAADGSGSSGFFQMVVRNSGI